NGLPAYGGVNMLEALNLGEAAGILELGHWSENPESFRRVSELLNAGNIPFIRAFAPQLLTEQYPEFDFSPQARLSQEHADKLWAQIAAGNGLSQWADGGTKHSDTVVAIDRWGNMTAVTHSINCVVWGKTGIIVDGVSIGDPAVSQKAIIAKAGPGNRLPGAIEIGLAFKDDEPVLAFASMSMGLHLETFQSLTNVLGFGMTPKQALDAPSILSPQIESISDMSSLSQTVRVMEGEFSEELMEATGLPYKWMQPADRRYSQGLWVGITRDPETGELNAASHYYTNGQALALE
ncbi:MAG: gamma-glutamyltransferase, partial [Gammaproteobacteria bacterium]